MAETPRARKEKQRQANRDAGLVRYHMKEIWLRPEHHNQLTIEISKSLAKILNAKEIEVPVPTLSADISNYWA
jgi:hypothetical protein